MGVSGVTVESAEGLPGSDQRILLGELTRRRVEVQCARGRVEIGRSPGSSVRVRITEPAGRGRLLRRAPRVEVHGGILQVQVRAARVQLDLPTGLVVHAEVRDGDVTSWGADGELVLSCPAGRVTGHELTASRVQIRSPWVSLHYAKAPELVEVDADQVTISVPAGEYAVTAPASAEVTVTRRPDAGRTIVVRGADVRILASRSPLRLNDEGGCGS